MRIERREDDFGAERLERVHELAGLFARARHDDALAEQRTGVEPAQVLAKRGDRADHENRRPRRSSVRSADAARSAMPCHVCCDGSVPSKTTARWSRGGRPCAISALKMLGSCSRARVADDGAVEPRQAGPVDARQLFCLVLVPAHERQRVAAARIRQRNACVAGRHRGRPECRARLRSAPHARGGTALPAPPRSKTKGSPHFRRATTFLRAPFPRAAIRWLPDRAARRGGADVDLLRVGARVRRRRGCTR